MTLPVRNGFILSILYMEEEQWKQIPICSNYEASTLGRIRRIGYTTILKPIPRVGKGTVPRWRFQARVDGKPKNICIHRAVATAFIPNPDNKPQIDHINGDPADNRVSNLRWATQSENLLNRTARAGRTLPKGVIQRGPARFEAVFRQKYLGSFSTVEEAKAAVNAAGFEYSPDYYKP